MERPVPLFNWFIMSLNVSSSYWFDTNTDDAIQAEKTYGYM